MDKTAKAGILPLGWKCVLSEKHTTNSVHAKNLCTLMRDDSIFTENWKWSEKYHNYQILIADYLLFTVM